MPVSQLEYSYFLFSSYLEDFAVQERRKQHNSQILPHKIAGRSAPGSKMYNPNSIGDNTQLIHQIQSDEVGQRLDRYLASILKNISRTGIQQLINDEQVFVNEKRSKPGYALRLNDEVRILQAIPSSQQKDFAPQVISLDVVYEDSDLLVINKAAGMVVHPAPGHHEDTLVNALLARYPELKGIGNDM